LAGIIIIKIHRAKGKNDFHVRFISRSYRIRGKEARIQINIDAIAIVFMVRAKSLTKIRLLLPEIKIAVSSLIIIILAYSAIKIRANEPLLYSVLNPDTSSDSPSAKSNGVRFVSASVVVNHVKARGKIISIIHDLFVFIKILKSKDEIIIRAERRINAILTSYEMVCATLRNAPNRAYFLLDTHPAARVEYTFRLETHRKIRVV